jgi:2-oxoglutarate ferredoxin oxidoreductase subunit gamma
MSRVGIKFTGFGGQGVVMGGIIIGRAASLYDGRHASQTQSYGPEARRGAAHSEVVISDQPIDYPEVEQADILVAMSQEALNRHVGTLKEGGTALVDEDLVQEIPQGKSLVLYRIPATRVASEELGRPIVANMVMLGATVGITSIVSEAALKTAVRESVPRGTEELNVGALERGLALAREKTAG